MILVYLDQTFVEPGKLCLYKVDQQCVFSVHHYAEPEDEFVFTASQKCSKTIIYKDVEPLGLAIEISRYL